MKIYFLILYFITNFGFSNQNQIENYLKNVNKAKNLTGLIPLFEKQGQNSFSHNSVSSSIAVHNSRNDFSSVVVDSSFNGYSFISDVTDPLAWRPDAGFVLSYRQFQGIDNSSGYIGSSVSLYGEEWFTDQGLNTSYPNGEEVPNLPTYTGLPTGRYPSSFITGDENINLPNVIWSEGTNADYGGGTDINSGLPLYTHFTDDLEDWEGIEFGEWYGPYNINNGCVITPCDPGDLLLPQVQEIRSSGSSLVNALFQQGSSPFMFSEPGNITPPTSYYWVRSNYFINGYMLFDDPVLLFDFSNNGDPNNGIVPDYAGRPKFHINDNGVGYLVFSGYGENYDSGGSLQSHTFFILKTEDYGETWVFDEETFNNGSFGFIPDVELNQIMLDAGLLGGTVQDINGNDVILDQAFMGYHYQIFTDNNNELHIVTTALPKNSESDSLYAGSPGAGYYHLHNSDPYNPGGWSASLIRDMSDSYKVQMKPYFPTWQYLYADVALSLSGETIWTVTSAIRDLIDDGDNQYTFDDLDLFGSVSTNNGLTWTDMGNLTDTPSGGAYGLNVEIHPHLAPTANDNQCFMTFQMPAFDGDHYDLVMNRIYFASLGTPNPSIFDIEAQQTNEDEPIIVNVNASSSSTLTYSVSSDTLAMPVYMDGTSIVIGLEENWNGMGTVTVTATDENQLSDTTDFTVTVLPVNDPPLPFSLIYPTVDDTIQVSTDTDETISFNWEESIDVDNDVNYTTTVSLDYFGNNYSLTYESNEPSVGIASYDWAVLMTNENIPRWTLEYVVEATDGEYTVESEIGQFVFENTSLSIDSDLIPLTFQLHQNYPNPFNPTTKIRYDLPDDQLVSITIYDVMGRKIRSLIRKNQTAGYYTTRWDARNDMGEGISAGMYIYTIQAGEFRSTKKMVLLK